MGSKQLMAFLLFFLLLLLLPLKEGPEFATGIRRAVRNSFIFTLLAFGTIFLFSAILAKVPMIIEQMQFDILLMIFIDALSWCFGLTIAVFVFQVLFYAVLSNFKKSPVIEKPNHV